MTVLGGIGFGASWLLVALAALPILWLILRAVPPAPVRRRFPGVALLLGLRDDETVSDRTPWWLILLRMLAVAAIIIGLAQPVLNPESSGINTTGPKLIVLDGSWAGAIGYTRQLQGIEAELDRATSAGQPVAILQLTNPKPLVFLPAATVAASLTGLRPNPWQPTAENIKTSITLITSANASSAVWFSDGLEFEGHDSILATLDSVSDFRVLQGTRQIAGLTPATYVDGAINLSALRANTQDTQEVTILAQGRFDKVEIKTTKLSDHTYMLEGAGGNIGVSVGDDGIFIIDDQFAPLSEKILTAIKILSDKPLTFLVNTHYHGDHSGGNENMTKAGATIIAHDNVKKRLEAKQRDGTLKPKEALPVITFNDKLNITINDESVAIFHVANAHTDGDILLYFTESNVLHTGDTYFNGRYPYIDLNSGGSVVGYMEAVKKGLMLIDEDTKIIPGHGKVSNQEDYKSFLKMLEELKTNIQKAIDDGKTEDEVKADTKLTKTYDDLDYGSGFINSEKIRFTFYKSLVSEE